MSDSCCIQASADASDPADRPIAEIYFSFKDSEDSSERDFLFLIPTIEAGADAESAVSVSETGTPASQVMRLVSATVSYQGAEDDIGSLKGMAVLLSAASELRSGQIHQVVMTDGSENTCTFDVTSDGRNVTDMAVNFTGQRSVSGSSSFTYDENGRYVSVLFTLSGISESTDTFEYDESGKLTSSNGEANDVVGSGLCTYDDGGYLTHITSFDPFNYSYDIQYDDQRNVSLINFTDGDGYGGSITFQYEVAAEYTVPWDIRQASHLSYLGTPACISVI